MMQIGGNVPRRACPVLIRAESMRLAPGHHGAHQPRTVPLERRALPQLNRLKQTNDLITDIPQ